MMQVIKQVQNGFEYANEIADSIGSTTEKVRNILYRAFKAGLLQRKENKRRGGIRYFI
jgi:predicted transcriptional regulator